MSTHAQKVVIAGGNGTDRAVAQEPQQFENTFLEVSELRQSCLKADAAGNRMVATSTPYLDQQLSNSRTFMEGVEKDALRRRGLVAITLRQETTYRWML